MLKSHPNRPKIKVPLSRIDKALEVLTFSILGAIWLVCILSYPSLPEKIPMHFNFLGEADRYDNKITLFIIPIISTVLLIALAVVSRFPHTFNYLVNITPENAVKQYTNAVKMLHHLKFGLSILFLVIVCMIVLTAYEVIGGVGFWFLPIVLAIILIPMVYHIRKSLKER